MYLSQLTSTLASSTLLLEGPVLAQPPLPKLFHPFPKIYITTRPCQSYRRMIFIRNTKIVSQNITRYFLNKEPNRFENLLVRSRQEIKTQ